MAPKTFVDLGAAYKSPVGAFVNIIGVVVDIQPPRQVPSGQYMFSFRLLDPALRDALYGSQGLTARFFLHDATKLPKVRDIGDVVLLRSVKMQLVNGQPVALSNFQTGVQVFPAGSIPNRSYSIAYQDTNRIQSLGAPADVEKLSLEEQAYVIQLKADLSLAGIQSRNSGPELISKKREAAPVPIAAPPSKKARSSTFGAKFRLVSETGHKVFSDVCGEVVKKFSSQFGKCELYVTDYTANNDMFYYTPPEEKDEQNTDGDDFGYNRPAKKPWAGPYGWLVLKVNTFEPHAGFANAKISEGDVVLLRNVKTSISNVGGKLEGDMWPDNDNPEKIKILKLIDHNIPEIKDVFARKEKYWAKRRAAHPQPTDEPVKPSKAEKKRQKKQRQQEERAKEAAAAAAIVAKNKHIRCSHEDAALMSVQDILDAENVRHMNTLPDGRSYVLPFVNTQYRTKVHVVDYEPKLLEDFAIPALPDDQDEPSPIDTMDWEASQKYEWYFSLLLEHASAPTKTADSDDAEKPRMWVHVRHEDAQFLFGNDMEDPQDLRSSAQLLAKLKEKLCILWGNLQEKRGDEVLSNRPFECCLQEYGVELDEDDAEKAMVPFGYKKLFRMFGTTIL